MRYTPAGIPVLQCSLQYQGAVVEAGQTRQVAFSVEAVVAGEMTDVVARLALGHIAEFTGFLASKRRNSKNLVFHITGCRPS